MQCLRCQYRMRSRRHTDIGAAWKANLKLYTTAPSLAQTNRPLCETHASRSSENSKKVCNVICRPIMPLAHQRQCCTLIMENVKCVLTYMLDTRMQITYSIYPDSNHIQNISHGRYLLVVSTRLTKLSTKAILNRVHFQSNTTRHASWNPSKRKACPNMISGYLCSPIMRQRRWSFRPLQYSTLAPGATA